MKKLAFNFRIPVLCMLLLSGSQIVCAQKVEGDALEKITAVRMPEAYKTPSGDVLKKDAPRAKSGEVVWFVYSDREDNQTFIDKNCTKPFAKINFLQPFIVAVETDDAVRLVAYDGANIPYEEKGTKAVFKKGVAEDQGWIKKKNLLLWKSCIVDDSTKYSKKAISVKKFPESKNYKDIIKKGVLDLYNYPAPKKEFDKGNDIRLFQYLFVYKEDKESKMFLLSKSNKTTVNTVSDDILGWAPAGQLHLWDNALCLRANFEQSAIDERKETGIDIKFFGSFEQAKAFRDGDVSVNLPFLYKDPFKEGNEKDNPYFYGFPIIGQTKESTIFKTGYVTQTMDESGRKIFNPRDQAKYNKVYQEIEEQKKKINIIFVLDGNSRGFIEKLQSAVNDNPTIGNSGMTRNEYKLGAIIYNDINNTAEEPFKVLNLNNNKDNFTDRLLTESKKPVVGNMNRETSGAPVYTAMKKACDLFPDSKTSNIIVLTGTVTDMDKEKKAALLEALVDKQVKLYAYQLKNGDGKLYDQYTLDCKMFLENTGNKLDEQRFKSDIASGKRKKAVVVADGDNFILQNSGVWGAFYSKDKGESFKVDDIKKRISILLRDIEENLNSLFALYGQKTVGAKGTPEQIDESQVKQLMMMLQDGELPDDVSEILASHDNFQLFIQAYAPLGSKKLVNQLLNKTLFMNSYEYDRLKQSFEKLTEAQVPSAVRIALREAYQDIIVQYKGGNVDSKTLNNFTADDFMKLVSSLPPTNNKLFKKSLKDLSSEKSTPDDEIMRLRNSFDNMYKQIKEVKKRKTNQMEQDDEVFYWIPEKVFQIEQ